MTDFGRRYILPFTAALVCNAILDLHHWLATGVAFGLMYCAGAMSQSPKKDGQ